MSVLARSKKILRWIAIGLIGTYAVYWVPVNLLLLLHFFPWLASEGKGKSFNIGYRLAASWIPGHLKVRGLMLRGTDPNVNWEVHVGKLDAQVDLLRLFKREFVVKRIQAEESYVDIQRHRERDKPAVIAKLHEGEKSEQPNPWLILAHRVDITRLRKVQIDRFHYDGDSDVHGQLRLRPGVELRLTEGQWLIREGLVKNEDLRIFDEMKGRAFVEIHPTDLESVAGSQIFRTMDIDADVTSRVFHAEVFGLLLKPYRQFRFGETEGDLKLKVKVDHGTILPGAHLDASLDKLDIHLSGASLFGRGGIKWRVSEDQKGAISRLDLGFDDLSWRGTDTRGRPARPLATHAKLKLHAQARQLSLVDPFVDSDIRLALSRSKMGRIQDVLKHFDQKGSAQQPLLTSEEGSFTLFGRIIPQKKWFKGKATYTAPEVRFSHNQGKTQLKAAMKLESDLRSKNFEEGRFDLRYATLQLDRIQVLHEGEVKADWRDWDAQVSLRDAKADFSNAFFVDGALSFAMANMKLPVKYAVPDNFWVSLGLWFFPMHDLNGHARLTTQPGQFAITRLTADSSSGNFEGSFLIRNGVTRYAVLVDVLPVDVCVDHRSQDSKLALLSAEERCRQSERQIEALAGRHRPTALQ